MDKDFKIECTFALSNTNNMITLQTIIPIFYDGGAIAPLSESDYKTLIGCLIVLTIIWVIWGAIKIIGYLIYKKQHTYSDFWEYLEWDFGFYIYSISMLFIYVPMILWHLGKIISLLF